MGLPRPIEMREPQTDPEFFGNTLDLTRPELRPVMGRYVTETDGGLGEGERKVLIMGRPPTYMVPLEEAFEEAGWTVTTCAGPGHVNCPLLSGPGACPARRSSDVTIAYTDGSTSRAGTVPLTKLLCAVDGSSPAIVALEGRMDEPAMSGNTVIMGAVRSPQRIVSEAERLTEKLP